MLANRGQLSTGALPKFCLFCRSPGRIEGGVWLVKTVLPPHWLRAHIGCRKNSRQFHGYYVILSGLLGPGYVVTIPVYPTRGGSGGLASWTSRWLAHSRLSPPWRSSAVVAGTMHDARDPPTMWGSCPEHMADETELRPQYHGLAEIEYQQSAEKQNAASPSQLAEVKAVTFPATRFRDS